MRVALVNTNLIQPPIAPIGLDYLCDALHAAGHPPGLLDLCWEPDPHAAIARFFSAATYLLVGITLRNTDDCAFASRCSFLPEFVTLVQTIRRHTDAPIVLGGVGFSVMAEEVLALTGADAGLWGEGEFVFPELARRVENREDFRGLPNLLWRHSGTWRRNPPCTWSLDALPPMSRTWVDTPRYFLHGGQAGFETKRGCPARCIYCADLVAKGGEARTRPPAAVADELERLLRQGIDHLHTCDSEFNLPASHAFAVCEELIRRRLGDRLRWYAYCSPTPFSPELARAMRQAGCVGINFGVDSGDAEMLRLLRRAHTPADILQATRCSKDAGIAVMLDLLLGAPGESRASLTRTVELMRQADPDCVGVSLGLRVYPGTALAAQVTSPSLHEGLVGGQSPAEPLFFLEPAVAPFASALLDSLIGDDPRFFFFDPARPARNYNYNANQRLQDAIRAGLRGAYWHILRRFP
jgi:hypothetical protein